MIKLKDRKHDENFWINLDNQISRHVVEKVRDETVGKMTIKNIWIDIQYQIWRE